MRRIEKKYANQKVWVVFSDETEISWLKFLKSGFRHCFIILNDGERWLSVDPLSPYTEIQIYHHIDSSFSLPKWLENQGFYVVQTSINHDHNKPAPLMLCTCVELTKRILGIHDRFIITPWQLYQYLEKKIHTNKIKKGDTLWAV